jgi:hypothetical protein
LCIEQPPAFGLGQGGCQSGILPRAVASILDTMRARAGRISSVLSCSALEFYMSRSEGL